MYVDDLVITGSCPSMIRSLTSHLHASFAVKDLGDLSYFLGIEVARCKEGLFLSQHKYVVELLQRHKMDGAKPLSTPSSSKTGSLLGLVNPTEYRSAIGSLQYLAFTRPDIAFTVNQLAQSMSDPSPTDWGAVKRLLRYLKGTLHFGLLLRPSSDLSITAYSDSDFGGDARDGKSTSAYMVFLGTIQFLGDQGNKLGSHDLLLRLNTELLLQLHLRSVGLLNYFRIYIFVII